MASQADNVFTTKYFETPQEFVTEFFNEGAHKTTEKAVLVFSHFMEATLYAAAMVFLPFSGVTNFLLLGAYSLAKRSVTDLGANNTTNPSSLLGGMAMHFGKSSLLELITGAAFSSFKGFALSLGGALPFIGYTVYVLGTSHYNVENANPVVVNEDHG